MNIHGFLHIPDSNYAYAYDNETLHIRLRTVKEDALNVTLRAGDPYDWTAGGGGGNLNAQGAKGWVYEEVVMEKEATTELFDFWFAKIKPPYRRLRYGFFVEDANQKVFYGEGGVLNLEDANNFQAAGELINNFCHPFLNAADVFKAPEWVKSTVWYQIFPDRFSNGDPRINPKGCLDWGSIDPTAYTFFGGDIQGIINRLDYLVELGITGIYTCPIFESSSTHKYDTMDYFAIDPQFGDKEVFREFVKLAHERGIRVMLDIVVNHCGYLFGPWQDVITHGENSKYKDWFHIKNFPVVTIDEDERANYDTFAFGKRMPKMKTENPEVRDFFLDVATYWIREFDIDGWRLDVSNEVDHAFWREFRKTVLSVKKDVYILGEIWHDSNPWLKGDQFDAVMNYPLTNAILDFIAKGKTRATQFKNDISKIQTMYSLNVSEVNFNLLNSHDTERILTTCGGNKDKVVLAYSFLMTLPGTPCIYYGDEIGMDGGDDPGCRKCMIWDESKQDLEMFSSFKKVIELRKTYPAMSSTSIKWIFTHDEENLVLLKKEHPDGNIYVLLNNSNTSTSVDLSILPADSYNDLITDRAICTKKPLLLEENSIMLLY